MWSSAFFLFKWKCGQSIWMLRIFIQTQRFDLNEVEITRKNFVSSEKKIKHEQKTYYLFGKIADLFNWQVHVVSTKSSCQSLNPYIVKKIKMCMIGWKDSEPVIAIKLRARAWFKSFSQHQLNKLFDEKSNQIQPKYMIFDGVAPSLSHPDWFYWVPSIITCVGQLK